MSYQRRRTSIGRRRDVVRLQERTSSSDGIGGQTASWATVATLWAAVVPLDGRDQEAIEGGQLTVGHNYHFDLRYRDGSTKPAPAKRILWRDKTLEIRTVVDDDMLRRRIVVQCAEVQDANAAA